VQPVQFGLWLQFEEEMHRYSLSYEIEKALSVKLPEPEQIIEHDVRLRLNKDKVMVIWSSIYCYILSENVSDKKHCIDKIMSTLEVINKIAMIDKLRKRKFYTHWILPTPQYDFVSLKRKYRETMFIQNDVTNAASDTSTLFDIKGDKWTFIHQSGAMEPQQLQQDYLYFKLDNVPKTFIFLAGVTEDKNVVQYSKEEMYSFMEGALESCVSHMEEFNRICEEHL